MVFPSTLSYRSGQLTQHLNKQNAIIGQALHYGLPVLCAWGYLTHFIEPLAEFLDQQGKGNKIRMILGLAVIIASYCGHQAGSQAAQQQQELCICQRAQEDVHSTHSTNQ